MSWLEDEPDFSVVALVASAGGLEALTRVLSPLPADFPAAIIGLQHQMPDRASHLTEILQRRSKLRLHVADEGSVLAPSCVFIAPPGKHTLMRMDGTLGLVVSGSYPPSRPSADLLLISLALCAGPRAIAVVLSGHGTDGATGATAIHDFGGVVIAADEASSQEFSMPRATIGRDNAVDHVAHVDEIAKLLEDIAGSPKEA
jgi:two-component system chemotaxis response regulator CheB